MSKIVDDVKSGLKAVRGAGDAIRGSAMEVTDQALDNSSNHPEATASQTKNRAITEKGKQDMHIADKEIGLRERDREAGHGMTGPGGAAPRPRPAGTTTYVPGHASAEYASGMTRPNDPQLR